jgi:hypothetical protein
MQKIQTEISISALESFVAETLGEVTQWAIRCPGAPGNALIAMQSKALEDLGTLTAIANDSDRLRNAIWDATAKISEIVHKLKEEEMGNG